MSPANFINIKQKIGSSPLLTDVEKKDWLYLLPRMTAEQIKELDRILSIKLPMTPAISPPHEGEIKRGSWSTPPVPSPARSAFTPKSAPITPVSSLQAPQPPARVPGSRGDLSFLASLTVNNLRTEKNPTEFLNRLVNTVRALLREGRINPLEISEAFATSSLYQAYVEAGLEKLENEQGNNGTLSQSEFEALADFRRDLRRLTGF